MTSTPCATCAANRAAEVERLRAALDAIADYCDAWGDDHVAAACERLARSALSAEEAAPPEPERLRGLIDATAALAALSGPEEATRPIHLQVTASTVRCGAPMRHWRDEPAGWDMGTVRVDSYGVTCAACLSRGPRAAD